MTLTELGGLVEVDPSFISRLENDKQEPSESLRAALADALCFEPLFFDGKLRDGFSPEQCHFRHLRRASKRVKELVIAQGSLLAELIHVLAEELDLPELDVPEAKTEGDSGIEAAAEKCRVYWNLGQSAPISNMIRAVENAGVVVIRLEESVREIDAFSRHGQTNIIVLNSDKGSATRSRFDIGHELGHLVLHRGMLTGDEVTETQANRFASAFLMPREGFIRTFRQMTGWSWAHLFEMKRYWKTSIAAIVFRASQLGLIGPIEYRRAYKYIYAKQWNKGEPYEPPIENPELLQIALDTYQRESGDLRELPGRLGWGREVFERIAGVTIPDDRLPNNVTQIASRRRQACP